MRHFFLFFLSIILLAGCGSGSNRPDVIDSGHLIYHIEYSDTVTGTPVNTMMPGEWNLYFNQEKLKNEIKAGFNLFSISFISNSPLDSCFVLFSFMEKDMYFPISSKDYLFIFDKNSKVTVTYDPSEKKEIAGFSCKAANVAFEGREPFKVYYTEEIKIIEPNRHTPLNMIPGVLMDFPYEYQGVRMRLTAKEYLNEKPPNRTFTISPKAKRTDKKEVVAMVNTLLSSF